MNKQQWKAEYSALRALFTAACKMNQGHKTTKGRDKALAIVWDAAKEKHISLYIALIKSLPYIHLPIAEHKHKWALKSNTRCY